MRDYAIFKPSFWNGTTGRQIRTLGDDAIIVAAYLFTSPGSNMIGLYYLPIPTMAHETGRTIEGARKGLQSLSKAGFAHYDEETETVWVPEMARFQIAESLKASDNRCVSAYKQAMEYRKSRYFQAFADRYWTAFSLPLPKPQATPLKAPSDPLGSQDQDQDQDQESERATDTHTPSPTSEFIEPWPTSATSPVIAPQAAQSTMTPPNPPQREDEHPHESTQSLGGIVKNGTMHTPAREVTPPDLSAKSGNLPITAPGRTGGSHTPTPPTGIATTGTGGASGNGSKPDPVGRSEWCESVEASWPPRVVEVFLAWRSTFVASDVKPPKLRQSDHDPIAAALRWDFEPSDIADSFRGWLKDELRCPNGVPAPMMTSIKSLLKTPDVITQGIMHAKARVGVAPSTRPESRAPVSDLPPKIDPALAKAKLAEMRRNKSQETPNET